MPPKAPSQPDFRRSLIDLAGIRDERDPIKFAHVGAVATQTWPKRILPRLDQESRTEPEIPSRFVREFPLDRMRPSAANPSTIPSASICASSALSASVLFRALQCFLWTFVSYLAPRTSHLVPRIPSAFICAPSAPSAFPSPSVPFSVLCGPSCRTSYLASRFRVE
jgi:hypothetical protein